MGRRLATLLTIGLLAGTAAPVLLAGPASAATFPSGFTDTTVAGSLGEATALAQLPDGRFLVTAQTGVLRVVSGASSSAALDLHATVDGTHPDVCGASEEGLLGVTVDPAFATNGYVYVYYTRAVGGSCTTPGNASGGAVNRVSRFTHGGQHDRPGDRAGPARQHAGVGWQPRRRLRPHRARRDAVRLRRRRRRRAARQQPGRPQPAQRQDPAHQHRRVDPGRQPERHHRSAAPRGARPA